MRVSDERAIWLVRHVLPHEPALRAWLSRRKLPGLEVDDIVQETYARLVSASSVDQVLNPKTYAFQTAQSVIMTHVRRARIVSFQAVADVDQLGLTADDPTPETQTAEREELHNLARAISALPGRAREVFTLRRVHGLSQRETAQRLGVTENVVEKQMSRGLRLLAQTFARGGEPGVRASRKSAIQSPADDQANS